MYKNIVLYSIGCPNCITLKLLLDNKKIEYSEVTDITVMENKGLKSAPQLEVDGVMYNYNQAKTWIGEQ